MVSEETRTVVLTLSVEDARRADESGLLTPDALEQLIAKELRRLAGIELTEMMAALHGLTAPEFTEDDVIDWCREAKQEQAKARAASR